MIDRNNIEEWLLLYADNELSADDRKAVESFLHNNPEIQQELHTLLDLRLVPEKIENKKFLTSLYMPLPVLGIEDMSQIIDYADAELDAETTERTKEKIDADSSWQEFYQSLQQVKLQPEPAIVFHNKNLLYQKPGTIFFKPTYLMRAAAAILIIITGIWLSTQYKREKPIVHKNDRKESDLVSEIPFSGFHDSVPKSKQLQKKAFAKKENNISPDNQTASILFSKRTESIQKKKDETEANRESEVSVVALNTQTITEQGEPVIVVPHNVIVHHAHAFVNNISVNRESDGIQDMQRTDPMAFQTGAQRVFKQAKRTFFRKLNETIGEEPIRISIIRINHR